MNNLGRGETPDESMSLQIIEDTFNLAEETGDINSLSDTDNILARKND